MIDLHCHILHGIDDGAQTVTDSLAMAQQAVAEGIHTIVATPHHQNGKYVWRAIPVVTEHVHVLPRRQRRHHQDKRKKGPSSQNKKPQNQWQQDGRADQALN